MASPARVIDASNGGLGLALKRSDAPWARHGAPVAVLIEPGPHWMVGVLRRVFAVEDELRLGVQILAAKPRLLSFSVETGKSDATWEEAQKFEASFRERYKKGILLEPDDAFATGGDMLLPAHLASRNSQFDVRLPAGTQRVRVTRIRDENEFYQRAVFEPLAFATAGT